MIRMWNYIVVVRSVIYSFTQTKPNTIWIIYHRNYSFWISNDETRYIYGKVTLRGVHVWFLYVYVFLWSLCGLELFWWGGGGAFRVGDSDIDGNMDMGSELVDGGNGARRLEPEL